MRRDYEVKFWQRGAEVERRSLWKVLGTGIRGNTKRMGKHGDLQIYPLEFSYSLFYFTRTRKERYAMIASYAQ